MCQQRDCNEYARYIKDCDNWLYSSEHFFCGHLLICAKKNCPVEFACQLARISSLSPATPPPLWVPKEVYDTHVAAFSDVLNYSHFVMHRPDCLVVDPRCHSDGHSSEFHFIQFCE